MAWFQKTAGSLEDAAVHIAKQSQETGNGEDTGAAETQQNGRMVAPGVRFSDRLWQRLGVQSREIEKQQRREKLTDATSFPEIPTSLFDATFRRDSVWKQRWDRSDFVLDSACRCDPKLHPNGLPESMAPRL